jgi:hypothetical protein
MNCPSIKVSSFGNKGHTSTAEKAIFLYQIKVMSNWSNMCVCLLLLFFSQCKTDNEQVVSDVQVSEISDSVYMARGQMMVQGTFDTLRTALLKTIGLSGVTGAVEYCNIHAFPITAHFADTFQAEIRRTSLKYRNPSNKPDELETGMLEKWEEMVAAGDTLQPLIYRDADLKVHYFQPIMVAEVCLKCHGDVGKQVQVSDYDFIRSKYPDDLAIGYQQGDLRGMWHVVFRK